MKAPNDLTKQWQQRLQTWRDSGLSQKEWCTQHDIKQPQFWYWKKKLGVSQHSSPLKNGFVPVTLSQKTRLSPELTVALPNGLTVSGIDQNNLSLAGQLIELLK